MQEFEMLICKICKQLQKRIQDGLYNSKDKRWKSEDGHLWNGKICPTCNRERIKETMRKKRHVQTS